MAVSTTSYFSNAFPVGNAMFKGNIFSSSTTPLYPVGMKIVRGDGAEYVYGHFGAATNRGLVVAQDLSETSVVDTDNAVIAPASAVAVPGETLKPGSIGSRYVELTLAAVTANQFEGGYLAITDDTGEGFQYRIKGNTATDNPATGNIRLELYDPLQAALDATSDIAITGCLYNDLEPATAATDDNVAGVSVATQASGDYGWVQTRGIATVLEDGAVVLSENVMVGAVAGSVAAAAALTDYTIGQVVMVGDDTGHCQILLNLY